MRDKYLRDTKNYGDATMKSLRRLEETKLKRFNKWEKLQLSEPLKSIDLGFIRPRFMKKIYIYIQLRFMQCRNMHITICKEYAIIIRFNNREIYLCIHYWHQI